MNIERPGSPSATTVAPTSKRRSTSIETRRSRLAPERPPKKGVATKNAFRSGELTAIDLIYSHSQRRQAGQAARSIAPGVLGWCAGQSGQSKCGKPCEGFASSSVALGAANCAQLTLWLNK